jgi:glycerol-3-phosphate dehydrogenase (NAD(P)+)
VRIAVIGAGSWGTALALHFARSGKPTILWGFEADEVREMRAERENARYLPGQAFPDCLAVTNNLREAVAHASDLLVAVPSHGFRQTLKSLHDLGLPQQRLGWATKGFETGTGLLPHAVAAEVFGNGISTAVLSGPTFAREVAAGLPSAMTVASADADFALHFAQLVSTDTFRTYTSDDIIGVEVGGATKNVLAIGAGISDGLGFGANTRVALITRGLLEMTRLGIELGAKRETFMGLSGVGDLVLTCTDDQSRNRRFGLALARGIRPEQALKDIGQVVEGYFAARAVHAVAGRLGVDMPIVEEIYGVIYEQHDLQEAVHRLMRRPITPE